jgi:predicted metal-dependent hydrolase
VTVCRRIRFSYDDRDDPIWTPRRPEFSCAANSVSLMMPIIEPYFVRSARRAQPLLPTDLAREAQVYLEQEAQHHGQHVVFNRLMCRRYAGLARTEKTMGWMYRWLEERGSLEFSCAFAAASETMAYSAARWAADHRLELFTGADDVVASLFLWHLAEEVEHKSVAFDIHQHLVAQEGRPIRAWFRHLTAMVVALALVVGFVFWGTTVMLAGERRLRHPVAWFRLIRWSTVFAFELLTNLFLSLFPGFHPDDLTDPLWYELWLREFDTDTATFPVWTQVPATPGIPTQQASTLPPVSRCDSCEERKGGPIQSGPER